MPFLPPNQQRQSTEGTTQLIHKKTAMMDLLAVGPESALPACHKPNAGDAHDYVSSCGIPMTPVMYQVVGYGRGDGRHSGRRGRSVVLSVNGDGV